jgi:glyoxylase-like metal-dependent hydrolase (beta-lactamase superfamily II)
MPHLVDPQRLWASAQLVLGFVSSIFGQPEPVPKERIVTATEGIFNLGDGAKLTVTETVGHASHNLSFKESFNNGVFPGDAAGTYLPEFDAVVPTTPPPFHLESALSSLDKLIALDPTALYYSHFGKASNGIQLLIDYKVQLKLWAKIVAEGVKADQTSEQISERILAEDKVMCKYADYFRSHPIYSRTVIINSLQGFIEYAKQTQTPASPS